MKNQVNRFIQIFEKDEDKLVEMHPLKGVSLSFLQDLFGEPKIDLMWEGYKINTVQARKLEPFIGGKIDTEKYDCFLACYAKNAE